MGYDHMNRYISQLKTRFRDIMSPSPLDQGDNHVADGSRGNDRSVSDGEVTNSSVGNTTMGASSSSSAFSSLSAHPLISTEDLHDAMLSLLLSEAQGHVRLLTVRMSDLLLTLSTELPRLGE